MCKVLRYWHVHARAGALRYLFYTQSPTPLCTHSRMNTNWKLPILNSSKTVGILIPIKVQYRTYCYIPSNIWINKIHFLKFLNPTMTGRIMTVYNNITHGRRIGIVSVSSVKTYCCYYYIICKMYDKYRVSRSNS